MSHQDHVFSITKGNHAYSIQDLGRKKSQLQGYAQAGAADMHAYCWANKLLQNRMHTPALEINFSPLSGHFSAATTISVTGAAQTIKINEQTLPTWRTYAVKAGDTLSVNSPQAGLKTYIGFKGGIKTNRFFESASQVEREKHLFRYTEKDTNKIEYTSQAKQSERIRWTPQRFKPDYTSVLTLELIPGYQIKTFNTDALEILTRETYKITPQSNRMGYGLKGNPLSTSKTTLLSEGIALGSVQIPPDGQPIVLLQDRQTIGGYPKIGVVSQLSCSQLCQRRPGQRVKFALTSISKAQQKLQRFYQFFSF